MDALEPYTLANSQIEFRYVKGTTTAIVAHRVFINRINS